MVVYSVANPDREVRSNVKIPNAFLYPSLPTALRPTSPTKKLRFKHSTLSTVIIIIIIIIQIIIIIIIIIENVNMIKHKHICKKQKSNTNFLRDILAI